MNSTCVQSRREQSISHADSNQLRDAAQPTILRASPAHLMNSSLANPMFRLANEHNTTLGPGSFSTSSSVWQACTHFNSNGLWRLMSNCFVMDALIHLIRRAAKSTVHELLLLSNTNGYENLVRNTQQPTPHHEMVRLSQHNGMNDALVGDPVLL